MIQPMTNELDLRKVLARERNTKVQSAFLALKENTNLVVVGDEDPRSLWENLRAQHEEILGWAPVESGPDVWRVVVSRLKPKDAEQDIFAFYARDHDEIDVILSYLRADTRKAAKDPELVTTPLATQFDAFDARLERHIRWEEEILFPAVEQKQPMLVSGPGRVMRLEHQEIRRLKTIAGQELHAAEPTPDGLVGATEALDRMFEVLLDHNRKEENVYYPMSDEIFAPAEKDDVMVRTRALR